MSVISFISCFLSVVHFFIVIKKCYSGSVQRTCSEVSVPASSTSGRNIKNQASCNKEEDGVTIVNDLAYCDRCTCNAKGQCYSCINTVSIA